MSIVEAKLHELGLVLPPALRLPPGTVLPFPWVRVRGKRAFVSGHGPQDADGSIATPLGRVGLELSVEQGYAAARLTALAMLGSLQRELGDLDRVTAWLRVFGMVSAAPGFQRMPAVINGFSDLVIDVWGEPGRHARSAIGAAELPFEMSVEVEAIVEVS